MTKNNTTAAALKTLVDQKMAETDSVEVGPDKYINPKMIVGFTIKQV